MDGCRETFSSSNYAKSLNIPKRFMNCDKTEIVVLLSSTTMKKPLHFCKCIDLHAKIYLLFYISDMVSIIAICYER